MKKIRTGVVGVGFIGAAHIDAVRRLGYVEVAAIAVRHDAEAIAERLSVAHAYTDYREMIDKENLDAIHICTPNVSHYEIAVYAMERGLHVMCEKPLAFTVAEAEALTKLAQETGLVNAVNFHCRYYPMIRQMREMVKENAVGRLLSVTGGDFQDWLLLDTDYSWRLESALSGESRAVADIGSHWVDAVEFITGDRICRVFADFATFHPVRKKPRKKVETFTNKLEQTQEYEEIAVDTEDYAQVLLEFESGARGNMTVDQMCAGRKNLMTISVNGLEKALYFNSESLNELWVGSRERYNEIVVKDPSLLAPAAASDADFFPGGHVEGFGDAFLGNFKAFYEQIQTGKRGVNAAFADGLREMRICKAIVDSARAGCWMEVK